MAGMPALGVTNTTLSGLALGNSVHVQRHTGETRIVGSLLSSRQSAQKTLVEACKQFMKDEGDVKITTLADIRDTIVV